MTCDRCGMEFGDLAPPGTFRHLEPLDCIGYLRGELDASKIQVFRLQDRVSELEKLSGERECGNTTGG